MSLDDFDNLIESFDNAAQHVLQKSAEILLDAGERTAATQRSLAQSDRVRSTINVRPQRQVRGDSHSVWIGPAWVDEDDPNIPWIEEYGTSRRPPRPYVYVAAEPHISSAVTALQKAASDLP